MFTSDSTMFDGKKALMILVLGNSVDDRGQGLMM